MIKASINGLVINGSLVEIMADISMIVQTFSFDILQKNMEKTPEEAREIILQAVETGMRPIEEIRQEAKLKRDTLAGLETLLSMMLGKKG